MANTWLLRESVGSDSNGGSSASVLANGANGVTNGTNTFTSSGASFTSALIGHWLYFTGAQNAWRQVTAVGSSTSLTFSGATVAAATSLTFAIGGARKTLANMFQTAPMASPFAAADTIWLGAGAYRGQTTINVAGSTTLQTLIAGDINGVNTGDAGEVILSPFSTGDATGSPSGTYYTVTCSATPHNYVFQDLTVYGPSPSLASNGGYYVTLDFSQIATAHIGLILQRCAIFGPTSNQSGTNAGFPYGSSALALCPDGSTSSLPTIVQNCAIFDWNMAVSAAAPAYTSNAITAGGSQTVILRNLSSTQYVFFKQCLIQKTFTYQATWQCLFIAVTNASQLQMYGCTLLCPSAPTSIVFQNSWSGAALTGCLVFGGYYNLFATITSATITGCAFWGFAKAAVSGGYTSGTATMSGTNTYGQGPPALDIGQSALRRAPARPWMTPNMNAGANAAPLFGQGVLSANSNLASDFLGQSRSAASSGMGTTPGYMEPWAPGLVNTNGTYVHSGTGSIKLLGFSSHSFEMPVDAVATSVSFYVCYDGAYAGSTYPSIQIRDGAQCGVADQEVSSTGPGAGTWQQVTANFTPTSAGVVTVRLTAKSTAIAGATYWDD
jgi:hypothetical protein